jgi:bifunctional non-homologous end joining protein LigD
VHSKAPRAHSAAGGEVDEQLKKYRSMRDFGVTAEPSGSEKKVARKGLPFVVQKHAATRLHYDFRLGWRGVLKSWAVTKGPSYVPADKRLAVQVEDHPIEYGGFEGTIPQGQYGGGTVMLWDEGTWEPQPGVDVDDALKAGNLKFVLHGKKLQGKWALIRMGGHAAKETKPNWLLIKEHDEFERGPKDASVTDDEPDSVVTGRDLDAIAGEQDHVWQSKPAKHSANKKSAEARLRARLQGKVVPREPERRATPSPHRHHGRHAKRAPGKNFVSPELAFQATEPPSGDGWLHELKYDGYRMQAICEGDNIKLLTRNGLDWTERMPAIEQGLKALELQDTVLDGEVVVLNQDGLTDFAALQAAFEQGSKSDLIYYVFDLLRLHGKDTRSLSLADRKKLLQKALSGKSASAAIRYSEHVIGTGGDLFKQACKKGAEGVVSKRADSPYRSGRQRDWIKVKCYRQQELVIGGFTHPTHKKRGVGALLLGYYEDGKLVSAGRTGTGFTESSGQKLREKLDKLKIDTMPFEQMSTAARKGAVWVRPKLVCEVSFATWTADGSVRQASFQGLREDKNATEVRREEPVGTQSLTQEEPTTQKHSKRKASKKSDSAKGGAVTTQSFHLTHPDKVLDAATGVTKQQLAEYLAAVSQVMLPHIAGRPVSLLRCPEGVGRPCFYQKHISKGMPDGVGTVQVPNRDGGSEEYVTVQNTEGLVGTAQMGALELHPWGSKNDSLETPDRLIFDLDPDTALPWRTVVKAAENVRSLLQKHGLDSLVKLSGGKGLHVVVPIQPKHEWPAIKAFCRKIAEEIEAEDPALYLIKMSKAARQGKIFIDYLRNERGATAIAPWGQRARAGMPCAVPLTWEELAKQKVMPQFRVADFSNWRQRVDEDPWAGMADIRQQLKRSDLAQEPARRASR